MSYNNVNINENYEYGAIDELLKDIFGNNENSESNNFSETINMESECYALSQKECETVCYGFEELPPKYLESIQWSRNAFGKLESSEDLGNPNEYEWLFLYYQDICKYPRIITDQEMELNGDVKIVNNVRKFTAIQIGAYKYDTARRNLQDSYFCAYQSNDEGEKILRPGQILFFFKHSCILKTKDNEFDEFDHHFAFVRWFNHPDRNQILSQYTQEGVSSCWQKTFEGPSKCSILPVHKLHSKVVVNISNEFKDICKSLFLPAKLN